MVGEAGFSLEVLIVRSCSLSSRLFSLRIAALFAPLALGAAFGPLLACGGSSDGNATGGNRATGGSPASAGQPPTGGGSGAGGGASIGGNGPGPGGASGGAALAGGGNGSATGGSGGSGGSATGGSSGNATGGISSGGGGGNGITAGSSSGGSSAGACPSGAYFCSGFEDATLPSALKTVYYNAQGLPTLDAAIHNSGKQSVTIGAKAGGGEMYLEAPASQSFWFRVYIRTDNGFTHNEHETPRWYE